MQCRAYQGWALPSGVWVTVSGGPGPWQYDLLGIASHFGLSVDALWQHPLNEDLRRQRGDISLVCPGDRVFVPDLPGEGFSA